MRRTFKLRKSTPVQERIEQIDLPSHHRLNNALKRNKKSVKGKFAIYEDELGEQTIHYKKKLKRSLRYAA